MQDNLSPKNPLMGDAPKIDPIATLPNQFGTPISDFKLAPPAPAVDPLKKLTIGSLYPDSNEQPLDNSLPVELMTSKLPSPAPSDYKRLTKITTAVVASVLLLGIAVITWNTKTTQNNSLASKNNSKSSILPNQNNPIQTSLNNATLKLNRNTIIGGGKNLLATGSVIIQNEVNSASALKIQDSAGSNLFIADTINNRIGIGLAPKGTAALQVLGDISSNGRVITGGGDVSLGSDGLRIGSTLICSARGCISSSSSSPTPSNPTIDVANVAYLNQTQTFSSANTFSNSGNVYSGNGANLTALDGSNLTSGTVADTRLSGNVSKLNVSQTFTGNNLFKGDNTNLFKVQDSIGSTALNVDTVTSRVAINQATANYTLDVNGDINVNSGSTYRINGVSVCSSSGCAAASGGNSYIQNGVGLQTANYSIQSANSGSVVALIKGAVGQTADLIQAKDESNNTVFSVGANGSVLIQPSTNSATAFQLLNNNATSHLIVGDTLNARVAIAQSSATYTLDVGGDINSSTGLRVGGTLVCASGGGCTAAAGSGSYVQNGTTLQSANFSTQSTANGSIAASIRGASGQTADLLRLVSGDGGTNIATFGATGDITFQPAIDSATALVVKTKTGGINLLTIDSSSQRIAVGPSAVPANGALTLGTNTTTASGGIYFGTDTNLYRSAAGTITTDGSLKLGSGSLLGFGASSTIKFQDGGSNVLNIYTSGTMQLSLDASGNLSLGGNGLLVLGAKASDPTCTTGATFYNTTTNSFRGCQGPSGATAWMDLITPPGSIISYAGASAPAGFFIADGTCISTSTYSRLFGIIGYTYGGAGASFCLPDLRGRTAVGLNASQTSRTDVTSLGNNEGAVLGSRTPLHKSTVIQPTISAPGINMVQPTISTPGINVVQPTISTPTITITVTSGQIAAGSGTGGSGVSTESASFTPRGSPTLSGSSTQPVASGGSASLASAPVASGGSASLASAPVASGGTVGPQSNVPTDTGAYLTVNYIIKF